MSPKVTAFKSRAVPNSKRRGSERGHVRVTAGAHDLYYLLRLAEHDDSSGAADGVVATVMRP